MDRCPKCGCTKTTTKYWKEDSGFYIEALEKCKGCGSIKNHWAYGHNIVVNWVDLTIPPPDYEDVLF